MTLHAHVATESQDCDGRYSRTYTMDMLDAERTAEFGTFDFKERVMNAQVSLTGPGRLETTEDGFDWSQPTEEGYFASSVEWCERPECEDQRSTFRDHTAEAAGY